MILKTTLTEIYNDYAFQSIAYLLQEFEPTMNFEILTTRQIFSLILLGPHTQNYATCFEEVNLESLLLALDRRNMTKVEAAIWIYLVFDIHRKIGEQNENELGEISKGLQEGYTQYIELVKTMGKLELENLEQFMKTTNKNSNKCE